MHRFFCSSTAITGSTITLTDSSDVRHIRSVLRLKPGDEIVVCDERGTEYYCAVGAVSASAVAASVRKALPPPPREGLRLTIACALVKNAKLDDIVDKLTQLGAARIIPIVTERVIVKWDAKTRAKHHTRWQAIAVTASKQSQRRFIPVVDPVTDFSVVLRCSREYDAVFIPTLEGQRASMKDAVACGSLRSVLVFIGPEGDFTPEEIAAARAAGAEPLSMGANVLRVDTAAIAAASVILIA